MGAVNIQLNACKRPMDFHLSITLLCYTFFSLSPFEFVCWCFGAFDLYCRSQAQTEHLLFKRVQNVEYDVNLASSELLLLLLLFLALSRPIAKCLAIAKIERFHNKTMTIPNHKYTDQIGYDSILCWSTYTFYGLCIFAYAFLPQALCTRWIGFRYAYFLEACALQSTSPPTINPSTYLERTC